MIKPQASHRVATRGNRTRRMELQNLKKAKKEVSESKSKKAEESKEVVPKCRETICALFLLQMPLHCIINYLVLELYYGGVATFGFYTLVTALIAMPIIMCFLFMGHYSQLGCIKYWQCVPLLKGTSYSLALMMIIPEIFNVSWGSLSLMYLPDLFRWTLPWSDCKFARATNTCLPMYPKIKYGKQCCGWMVNKNCSNETLTQNYRMFSTMNYFRFNKLNEYVEENWDSFGPIKIDWLIIVILVWILILIIVLKGVKHINFWVFIVQIVVHVIWLVTLVITLFAKRKADYRTILFAGSECLITNAFWLNMIVQTTDRTQPNAIILFGCLSLNLKPDYATAKIFVMMGIKLFAFTVWVPILFQSVLFHYQIIDGNCLKISGFDVFFALVPDVLSRVILSRLWLGLWFTSIFLYAIASAAYTITAFVNSLIDAYPGWFHYRSHIVGTICGLCAASSSITLTRLALTVYEFYSTNTMNITSMIVLFLITTAVWYIYTVSRLINDYDFTFKNKPRMYWIWSWKITPFIFLFQLPTLFYYHVVKKKPENTARYLIFSGYAMAVILLLPILLTILWLYCKHVRNQTVSTMIQSGPEWGYHDLALKKFRRHFNPQKELKYKVNVLKCRHKCLKHSSNLIEENKQQTESFKRLHKTMSDDQ